MEEAVKPKIVATREILAWNADNETLARHVLDRFGRWLDGLTIPSVTTTHVADTLGLLDLMNEPEYYSIVLIIAGEDVLDNDDVEEEESESYFKCILAVGRTFIWPWARFEETLRLHMIHVPVCVSGHGVCTEVVTHLEKKSEEVSRTLVIGPIMSSEMEHILNKRHHYKSTPPFCAFYDRPNPKGNNQ